MLCLPVRLFVLPEHEEHREAGRSQAADREIHLGETDLALEFLHQHSAAIKLAQIAARNDGGLPLKIGGFAFIHGRFLFQRGGDGRGHRPDFRHGLPGGGGLFQQLGKLGLLRWLHLAQGVKGQAGIIWGNLVRVHVWLVVGGHSGCTVISDRSALRAVCRMKPTLPTDSDVMRLISW